MLDLSHTPPATLHNQPREVPLKDGRGAPLGSPPAALVVVGCYSDEYVAAQRDLAMRVFSRSNRGIEDGADKLRKQDLGLEILIACVKDWRNVFDGGQPAPFSPEKLRALLKGYPFVRDQLELFIHSDRNFTQGGLPSSPSGPVSSSPSTTPTP